MALKRTTVFLDPQDYRALFAVALEESRKAGRRVTVAEIIRRAVRARLLQRIRPKDRPAARLLQQIHAGAQGKWKRKKRAR